MKKNSIVIFAGWSIDKIEDKYFIPKTHYTYVSFISSKYTEVIILSPTRKCNSNLDNKIFLNYKNVKVYELPNYNTFIGSIKYFFSFYRLIKSLKEHNLFYCRVPDPYSWLPKLFFRKECIIHFVGDGFDSIWSNQFTSLLKKIIFTLAYTPDFILTLLVCYKSKVFTNGEHIAKRLKKFKVNATPLISSTLTENDFHYKLKRKSNIVNLLYLGYLSPHKGIKTIIEFIDILQKNKVNYKFNIIGDGVMKEYIENYIKSNNLYEKIILYGHINDREFINQIIDNSDFFIFPSISEGSPRVILEVMARNLPVISTPVGSLPFVFKNRIDILFAEFNNAISFYNTLLWALNNYNEVNKISSNAFFKVKNNYTIDKFLNQIFT